jgi:hypothetical protein
MKMIKINKEDLIDKLINDDIDTIIERYSISYLADILRDGFCGYSNYTDKQLIEEGQDRFEEEIQLIPEKTYCIKCKKELTDNDHLEGLCNDCME